jgi:hypothetical protein
VLLGGASFPPSSSAPQVETAQEKRYESHWYPQLQVFESCWKLHEEISEKMSTAAAFRNSFI